jgi:hypothetical protein
MWYCGVLKTKDAVVRLEENDSDQILNRSNALKNDLTVSPAAKKSTNHFSDSLNFGEWLCALID